MIFLFYYFLVEESVLLRVNKISPSCYLCSLIQDSPNLVSLPATYLKICFSLLPLQVDDLDDMS